MCQISVIFNFEDPTEIDTKKEIIIISKGY